MSQLNQKKEGKELDSKSYINCLFNGIVDLKCNVWWKSPNLELTYGISKKTLKNFIFLPSAIQNRHILVKNINSEYDLIFKQIRTQT